MVLCEVHRLQIVRVVVGVAKITGQGRRLRHVVIVCCATPPAVEYDDGGAYSKVCCATPPAVEYDDGGAYSKVTILYLFHMLKLNN